MSSNQEAAVITGGENNQPTLEESHAKLVAEGVISDDVNDNGANTEPQVDPEGTQGGGGNADDNASKSLDKFKDADGNINVDALQKSYLELEKMNSKGEPAGETADDAGDGTKLQVTKEPTADEQAKVKEIAEKAEVNLLELSNEWLENGELTEDHYTKLEAQGYPREMVDTYAKGLTSDVGDITASAVAIAGGNEQYDEMLDWAVDNLSPAEEKAFDDAVNSRDKAKVLQAVRALNAQYQSATNDGTQEPSEQINGKVNTSGASYQHMDDYMEDLNDPRYAKSESFRQSVMEKLSRSNI